MNRIARIASYFLIPLFSHAFEPDRLVGSRWECTIDGENLGTLTFRASPQVELSWKGGAQWQPILGGVQIFGANLTYSEERLVGSTPSGKSVTLVRAPAPQSESEGVGPSPAAPHAPKRFIPGIAAVDVYGNLTNKGFALEKTFGEGETLWTCRSDKGTRSLAGQAYGAGPSQISLVQGTALSLPGDIDSVAVEFLGFLASLPYDGAEPAKARAWVESNIHQNSSTRIGGVKFEIIAGAPAARILRISMKP